MKGFLSETFALLLFHFTGAASGQTSYILGTLGESTTLPCYNSTANTTVTWSKNGTVISASSGTSRFQVVANGSLLISNLLVVDEGAYQCMVWPAGSPQQPPVLLRIVEGPDNVSTAIGYTDSFPNGTLFVRKGVTVYFNCSGKSYPSQNVSWILEDLDSNIHQLASNSGSSLHLQLQHIHPSNQGKFSCVVQNTLSNRMVTRSAVLLVFYAPEREPDCYGIHGNDTTHIILNCTWAGGNPPPTLQWTGKLADQGGVTQRLNVSTEANSLEVQLNRSQLYNGQALTCQGSHRELNTGDGRSCTVTLQAPYPVGDPLVTTMEGMNVTLMCMESISIPPAVTKWMRTLNHLPVVNSSKHVISQQGPKFFLTILNVSMEDQDYYFCHSENPVKVQELEIYLTVKPSKIYAGEAVGTFLAVIIMGAGVFFGIFAYRSRDKICLGNAFSHSNEERTDVFNLVDSEDEMENDSEATINPTANGDPSSVVQVHNSQASDREDQDVSEPDWPQ